MMLGFNGNGCCACVLDLGVADTVAETLLLMGFCVSSLLFGLWDWWCPSCGWCNVVRHGSLSDCSSFEHGHELPAMKACKVNADDCNHRGNRGMLELMMQAFCRPPCSTAKCASE